MNAETSAGVLRFNTSRESVRPPNSPWVELVPGNDPGGFLTFYYCDDLSPLPVRGVTKPKDNKSDPNLETQTYGLFSTCAPNMRASIVRKGLPYLFHQTRRDGERIVAGYYHIRWYAPQASGRAGDVALAADECHFVEEPIPIREVGKLLHRRISETVRSPITLDAGDCVALRLKLDKQPDATQSYLSEIERLERFNLKHGGSRHVGWHSLGPGERYDWENAARYLLPSEGSVQDAGRVRNTTPSGWWKCEKCQGAFENIALLRLCKFCGSSGTLRPAEESEIPPTKIGRVER